jgi:hypothetical protein
MPTSIRETDNQSLITTGAAMRDHDACIEMLIQSHYEQKMEFRTFRHWAKFDEIEAFQRQGMSLFLVPYQLGIATAVTAAFAFGSALLPPTDCPLVQSLLCYYSNP